MAASRIELRVFWLFVCCQVLFEFESGLARDMVTPLNATEL